MKPDVREHTCSPSTWEMGLRALDVHGQPWQHMEFEAKLGCMELCL